MKFIWNEPKKMPESDCHWPEGNWTAPVIAWLNYNNVNPKIDRDHWDISYNYVWHFYDISIFECWLPGNGRHPRVAIDAMTKYLESTNLDCSLSTATWRWDDGKTRPGVRFFIQAEDFPKKYNLS